MTAPLSIQVISAQPGFVTVYDFDDAKEVALGEPVIAWRVETYSTDRKDSVFSVCVALTVDGDAVSNCIGVQNPDKTVTVFNESNYASLGALQANRYPE